MRRAPLSRYPEQIAAILKDPERKVTDIAGIGKGIAFVLAEIEQRGSFDRRDEMLEKYPAGALELLKIQGLGPKSIRLLFENLPLRHHRRSGTPLPRAEIAGTAAHGRETGRESTAVDRQLSPAGGAVPAELRGRSGGRAYHLSGSRRRG